MVRDTAQAAAQPVLLVTRHGKAKAIAPPLQRALHARIGLAVGVDTDCVRRDRPSSDCIEAALAKVGAGFDSVRYARFAIASAGEFTVDPASPKILSGYEVVILAERDVGILASGRCEVRRANETVTVFNVEDATALAVAMGFPRRTIRSIRSFDESTLEVTTEQELELAVRSGIRQKGFAVFEKDRRAHRCEWRMDAIRLATEDLVNRIASSTRTTAWPFHLPMGSA